MAWTEEELREMAAADAEIEAEFSLSYEDIVRSRKADKEADKTEAQRDRTAQSHAYYMRHKDACREYSRKRYYEMKAADPDKIRESRRAYYEGRKDEALAYNRAYRARKRKEKLEAELAVMNAIAQAESLEQKRAALKAWADYRGLSDRVDVLGTAKLAVREGAKI